MATERNACYFELTDTDGQVCLFTPEAINAEICGEGEKRRQRTMEIYHRVNPSKEDDPLPTRNFNWIAALPQILRTVDIPSFPEPEATEIKCSIMRHLIAQEQELEDTFPLEQEVLEDITSTCLSALPYDEENTEAMRLKQDYILSVARSVIASFEHRMPLHPGSEAWMRFKSAWTLQKVNEYIREQGINSYRIWQRMREQLSTDFSTAVETAEAAGAFEKDDRAWREAIRHSHARQLKKYAAAL